MANDSGALSALRSTARRYVRALAKRTRGSSSPALRRSYRWARTTGRRIINLATKRQLGWMATLRTARWVGERQFQVGGWAYERGYGFPDSPPQIRVWLQSPGISERVEGVVTLAANPEANAGVKAAEFDYANTGFTAVLDLDALPRHLDAERVRTWRVMVEVAGARYRQAGWFKFRHRFGSVRFMPTHTLADGVQLTPRWQPRRGLFIDCHRPEFMARDVSVEGEQLRVALAPTAAAITEAFLSLDQLELPLGVQRVDGAWVLSGDIHTDIERWRDTSDSEENTGAEVEVDDSLVPTHDMEVVLVLSDGRRVLVHCAIDESPPVTAVGSRLLAYSGTAGQLVVRDVESSMVVEDVSLEKEPRLGMRMRGIWRGEVEGTELVFAGPRQQLPVELEIHPDGTWDAFAPLLVSVWDQPAQVPMLGGYTLRAYREDGSRFFVTCVRSIVARASEKLPVTGMRLFLEIGAARQLRLRVGVQRRDNELGSYHQSRLERRYQATTFEPAEAVYFESFYGRKATCNPLAIDRVIAQRYPDMPRYWGVTDNSVPVPEGAIKVVSGTKEWWQARGTSRYIVVNDWIRRRFKRQPFQVVLQTWHGSMLKRIGLDRMSAGKSTREQLKVERDKWDILLSQNRHSTEIFKSAYAWDKTFFEEGYPRNDAMVDGDGAPIRERLGIKPHQTAILYAPTWRDNLTGMVTFLDLERLTADLGDSFVVLLRGHSRTLQFGENVDIPGVVDVTTYPDITELFLAADVLITDYSSVMFDYSVTGRPMIFFVPDMDDYRDSVRGVYFDLSTIAPGPVVMTQDEVVDALRTMELDESRYAERYAAWRQRFNHLDDGHSAERVVERLFAFKPTM